MRLLRSLCSPMLFLAVAAVVGVIGYPTYERYQLIANAQAQLQVAQLHKQQRIVEAQTETESRQILNGKVHRIAEIPPIRMPW